MGWLGREESSYEELDQLLEEKLDPDKLTELRECFNAVFTINPHAVESDNGYRGYVEMKVSGKEDLIKIQIGSYEKGRWEMDYPGV